jgi:hypothetical protein
MRIVLLGASGNAGREIARLLTPSLGAGDVMVLAGRDQQRLAATAEVTSGPATIQVETVDAEDDASVQRLVAGATIVVVTASVPSAFLRWHASSRRPVPTGTTPCSLPVPRSRPSVTSSHTHHPWNPRLIPLDLTGKTSPVRSEFCL